ncbi:hypothetical protein FRB99_000243 [Tulasnella sp. 403]|nr:hypothetical protein FRB99_000243 [Tulasnella sp. 403]
MTTSESVSVSEDSSLASRSEQESAMTSGREDPLVQAASATGSMPTDDSYDSQMQTSLIVALMQPETQTTTSIQSADQNSSYAVDKSLRENADVPDYRPSPHNEDVPLGTLPKTPHASLSQPVLLVSPRRLNVVRTFSSRLRDAGVVDVHGATGQEHKGSSCIATPFNDPIDAQKENVPSSTNSSTTPSQRRSHSSSTSNPLATTTSARLTSPVKTKGNPSVPSSLALQRNPEAHTSPHPLTSTAAIDRRGENASTPPHKTIPHSTSARATRSTTSRSGSHLRPLTRSRNATPAPTNISSARRLLPTIRQSPVLSERFNAGGSSTPLRDILRSTNVPRGGTGHRQSRSKSPTKTAPNTRGRPPTTPPRSGPSPSIGRSMRRPPTTPTTALHPASRRISSPSQDSFTRLTAAEAKDLWLRSDEAQGISPRSRRRARGVEYESDPSEGNSRARPRSPPKVPSRSPQLVHDTARLAFRARNDGGGSRPTSPQRPPTSAKGKERAGTDEELSSQLSQLSVEQRAEGPSAPHVSQYSNVLVPRTPTNSSGSADSRPLPQPVGFDFSAPIPEGSDDSQDSMDRPPPVARPATRPRSPSLVSYTDPSSAGAGAGDPATPPRGEDARAPAAGEVEITPTQPSEVCDSQHPLLVAARARFTAPSSHQTADVSAEGGTSATTRPIAPPPPPSRLAGLSRRLEFDDASGSPRKPTGVQSMEDERQVLRPITALADRLMHGERIRSVGPSLKLQYHKPPKIFPSAGTTRRTLFGAGGAVEEHGEVAGTPQPLSDESMDEPSTSPRREERPVFAAPSSKGKGRAVIPWQKRREALAPSAFPPTPIIRPFVARPASKRTFREMNEETEGREVDIASTEEVSRQVVIDEPAHDEERTPRKRMQSSPKQYSSRAKKAREAASAQKARRTNVDVEQPEEEAAAPSPVSRRRPVPEVVIPLRHSSPARAGRPPAHDNVSEDEVQMEVDEPPTEDEDEDDTPPAVRRVARGRGKRARSVSVPRRTTKSRVPKRPRTIPAAAPTSRVFARWRDKHYYPAVVIGSRSTKTSTRYVVAFDDGDVSNEVDVSKLRRGELVEGDVVCIGRTRGVVVRAGEGVVVVKTGEDEEVWEWADVKIPEKEVERTFDGRTLRDEDVEVEEDVKGGRGANRAAVVPPPPARRATIRPNLTPLASYVVVITTSPGSDVSEAQKTKLRTDVESLGGTVCGSWDDVYGIGSASRSTVRGGVRWACGKKGAECVLCLADRPTQTIKYLLAVALGVPCVSSCWIGDLINGVDLGWRNYVLAAGRVERMNNADVSQVVDPLWGIDGVVMKDVFRSAVVRRPFRGLNVLFVSRQGKGLQAPPEGGPPLNLRSAQMMVAMGAESVEVVGLAEMRKREGPGEFVVVYGEGVDVKGGGGKTWAWVKDCLISGCVVGEV